MAPSAGGGEGRVKQIASQPSHRSSFAQLVAVGLHELLHPAWQLPVEAGDVEVFVDMNKISTNFEFG